MRIHWAQDGTLLESYGPQIPKYLEDWDYVMWIEFYDYHAGAVISRHEYINSSSIHRLPINWTYG